MNQALRIDPQAEEREIELLVAEMTAREGKYYPFTRDHIAEAISEMPATDFGGLEPFGVIREWCAQYWNEIAERDAEQAMLRNRP